MTDDEMNEEVKRRVAQQLAMLSPLILQIAVTQAVVAAMVATHHDPALLRQRAESLLMQGQGRIALFGGQLPKLPNDQVQAVLDYLFRPVVYLDPE